MDFEPKEKTIGFDRKTIDEVCLRLSGLIGVFDLVFETGSGDRDPGKRTILDFSLYVSNELRNLYEMVAGISYDD